MPRLSIGQLRRRLNKALMSQDLDDDVHHVFVYWNGVLFDAKLEFSKRVRLTSGEETIAYGLIFSPEGADEPINRPRPHARGNAE